MFRPARMRHVTIHLLEDDLPRVSLALAETEAFNPDLRQALAHELPRIPGERYRQIYRQAHARFDKIIAHFPASALVQVENLQAVSERDLATLNDHLGLLWQECSECQEDMRRLDAEQRAVDQLESALANFANLQVDLGLLQGDKGFLDLHIGVVPSANTERMAEALSLARFFVFTFLLSNGNAHVIVAGLKGDATEHVRGVLDSAGFQALTIPPELRDEPAKVALDLAARRANINTQREALAARVAKRARETTEFIKQAKRTLALAEPYVNLDGAACASKHVAAISGWIPARELDRVTRTLQAALSQPFVLTDRAARLDERPVVPSLLTPSRLLLPFTAMVSQYGVPRYGEFDPSAVFAITFVLMFGMMFGDVGHGATIAVAAWYLRRRLGKFTTFAVFAGLSSIGFGFLYGSVFGLEHVLVPLWMPPLSDPILMLKVALAWGVGFLLLMSALAIHNRLVDDRRLAALFDTHGAANAALYLGLLWGGYNIVAGLGFEVFSGLLVTVSLLSLAVYKWHQTRAPFGERLMVVLVETFETVMGYISSTLSFLRVAAFSLNHAALALAVFTVADMMSATGHWVMVFAGNLFILVLEGAIVAIQVLRLEYYEGFTRFYSGDGSAFRPLRIARWAGVSTAPAATLATNK